MPAPNFSEAVKLVRAKLLRQEALKSIGGILGTGAGAGLLLRGGIGVGNILNRNMQPSGHDNPLAPYTVFTSPSSRDEEKSAGLFGAGTLIGAGVGGVSAPGGSRMEGVGRGATQGFGFDLGGLGGAGVLSLAGGLAGPAIAAALNGGNLTPDQLRGATLTGAGVGGLGGYVGGGLLGRLLAKKMIGKPSWEKEKESPDIREILSKYSSDKYTEQEKCATIGETVSNFLEGNNAQTVMGLPWYLPAATLAGAAGGVGGYKLMDTLLDRNRKGLLKDELARAKQEYEAALSGSVKSSEENTLAYDLDKLASDMLAQHTDNVKKAGFETGIGDVLGSTTGLYLLGALGTAGYIGNLAYDKARKNSRRRLLEKARKQVARERVDAPLYAQLDDQGGI